MHVPVSSSVAEWPFSGTRKSPAINCVAGAASNGPAGTGHSHLPAWGKAGGVISLIYILV